MCDNLKRGPRGRHTWGDLEISSSKLQNRILGGSRAKNEEYRVRCKTLL